MVVSRDLCRGRSPPLKTPIVRNNLDCPRTPALGATLLAPRGRAAALYTARVWNYYE
jgi:hypothetical protein